MGEFQKGPDKPRCTGKKNCELLCPSFLSAFCFPRLLADFWLQYVEEMGPERWYTHDEGVGGERGSLGFVSCILFVMA